jgi:hypothetical protein
MQLGSRAYFVHVVGDKHLPEFFRHFVPRNTHLRMLGHDLLFLSQNVVRKHQVQVTSVGHPLEINRCIRQIDLLSLEDGSDLVDARAHVLDKRVLIICLCVVVLAHRFFEGEVVALLE